MAAPSIEIIAPSPPARTWASGCGTSSGVAGLRRVDLHDPVPAGRPGLVPAWRARLGTIGRDVRVERVDRPALVGRAVDVDADGALVLRLADGTMATVAAGDVEHLRAAP